MWQADRALTRRQEEDDEAASKRAKPQPEINDIGMSCPPRVLLFRISITAEAKGLNSSSHLQYSAEMSTP